MASDYSWTIMKDFLDDKAVGTTGPCDGPLDRGEIRRKADAQEFLLSDDDGKAYFLGLYVGPESESLFGPLDDYGRAFGCSMIEYKVDGDWQII